MSAPSAYPLLVYLHLAQAASQRGRPLVRGRMLLLAYRIAVELEIPQLASHCRAEILAHNPHHLIGRAASTQSVSDELRALCQQLLRRYPLERAERLLESLQLALPRSDALESRGRIAAEAARILGLPEDAFRHDLADGE